LENDEHPDLPLEQPDCDDYENLPAQAQTWCDGDDPDSDELAVLNDAWESIEDRCPFLSSAWSAVQGNIRVWTFDGEDYGGAAAVGGSWMLLSRQWLDADPELALAHELLHVAGYHHRDAEAREDFVAKEKQCSGGRSALDPSP